MGRLGFFDLGVFFPLFLVSSYCFIDTGSCFCFGKIQIVLGRWVVPIL
jgi:hypothetical protein